MVSTHAALRFACAAVLLLAVAAVPVARAQAPSGLRTQFRLVNSMSDGSNLGDTRFDDGWAAGGPLITHGANTVTNPLGMISSSDFTAVADYGRLRFFGSGSATTVPGNGAFLIVDDAIGSRPNVEYVNRVYVTSSTLAAGTPVSLQFQQVLIGGASVVDPYPILSYRTELTVTDTHFSSPLSLVQSGVAGSVSGTFNSSVGDSVDMHGALYINMGADGVRTSVSASSSIAADLVALSYAVSLTPGATITFSAPTVGVPSDPSPVTLSLEGARPNPASVGRLMIHFTLPSPQNATLALFDLSGRIVASADVGSLGPGPHALDLAQGRHLAPGVYLARLEQGATVRTARVAVFR